VSSDATAILASIFPQQGVLAVSAGTGGPPQSGAPTLLGVLPESWEHIDLGSVRGALAGLSLVLAERRPRRLFLVFPFVGLDETMPHRQTLAEQALETALAALDGPAQVAALVPRSLLLRRTAAPQRGHLFAVAAPRLVLDAPEIPRALGLAPDAAAVLTFELPRLEQPVAFFRSPLGEPDAAPELARLLAEGTSRYGYRLPVPPPADQPLEYELHSPLAQARHEGAAAIGRTARLSDHFEVRRTVRLREAPPGEGVRILRSADVRNGRIDLAGSGDFALARDAEILTPGDLVVRALHLDMREPRLSVAEVRAEHGPLVPSPNLVVLRPHAPMRQADRDVIRLFLESPLARDGLMRLGNSLLYPSGFMRFGELEIPIPEGDLATAVETLADVERQLVAWHAEARAMLESLYLLPFDAQRRAALLQTGQRLRERVRSARLQDDRGYRFRTSLPHPIAFRWRTIEVGGDDGATYDDVLETAEVTACYLAVMALVSARAVGVELGQVKSIAGRLASGSGSRGITLGDWSALLDEFRLSRKIRARAGEVPFPELLDALDAATPGGAAFRALCRRRHDKAHGRGPDAHEIAAACRDARREIADTLDALEFLADYPLRFVESTHRDALARTTRYEFRDLRGDHALVPVERGEDRSPDIEARSLYLRDRKGGLHLVRPFLHRVQCPACGSWATFVVDRFHVDTSTTSLRALEHRHSITRDDLEGPLRVVGLLSQ